MVRERKEGYWGEQEGNTEGTYIKDYKRKTTETKNGRKRDEKKGG